MSRSCFLQRSQYIPTGSQGLIHLTAYYDFRNRPDQRYTELEQTFPQLLHGLDKLLPTSAPPVLRGSSMPAPRTNGAGLPALGSSPRIGSWAYRSIS